MRAFATVLLAAGALGATKHGASLAVAPKAVAPTVVAPEAGDAPPALFGAINLMEPELRNVLSTSGAYDLVFSAGTKLRSGTGSYLHPQGRQDIPVPVIVVGIIAKIILIILFATGVIGGETTATEVAGGLPSTPTNDGSSLGVMLTDFVNNNPNLIQEFTTSILPALTPLVIAGEDEAFNYDALLKSTQATAITRFSGLQGELYMAQIASAERSDRPATVISGGLEGLSPNAAYTLSLHRSGDVSGGCASVGDQFSNLSHKFKTDPKGRIVLLMRETAISLRDSDSIMGRSVVIAEQGGDSTTFCGVVMSP